MERTPKFGMFEMLSKPRPVETVLELSRPIEAPADQGPRDENLTSARGIVIGIVISVALWAGIIAALI